MPDAYLFDIGNVIIAFDFEKTIRRVAPLCSVPPEEALAIVGELTPRLETGQLGTDDYLALSAECIGYTGDLGALRHAFEDIFELNEPLVRFIETQSAAGIPLHLLSNTNGIHVPFFEKTYRVFDHFEGRIYSHEVGVMKPDPRIYEIVTETLGIDPATTIYVDDRPENCEAGRAVGFLTHQYEISEHEAFLDYAKKASVIT